HLHCLNSDRFYHKNFLLQLASPSGYRLPFARAMKLCTVTEFAAGSITPGFSTFVGHTKACPPTGSCTMMKVTICPAKGASKVEELTSPVSVRSKAMGPSTKEQLNSGVALKGTVTKLPITLGE